MQNNFGLINLKDLETPESFRNWIKKSLPQLYLNIKIPEDHLLIYLDYLKEKVIESQSLNQSYWMDLIRNLKTRIEVIKSNKDV